MKIKVSEVSGVALAWLVALIEGKVEPLAEGDVITHQGGVITVNNPGTSVCMKTRYDRIDSRQILGPTFIHDLMSHNRISVEDKGDHWRAWMKLPSGYVVWRGGSTILTAVARCRVASVFGDEPEVPDELLQPEKVTDPCPDCGKQLQHAPGGGVKCSCGYWFCY